ncbi:DNA replication/repair protein RecF [Lacibacter sediminis]|uniref:DNA replication and repair protein RecF n=1 Tax=Lacibacter sediminis TaxID=2760713 RepID=A0A7G5XLL9_9BACT|nr:DNA replication and repair protein RecF [Lacibacter sediminis]QNA46372.1 DNA replication and repair protein RecF [Lacibacter sediminis]
MFLRSINITQFKNYTHQRFSFGEMIVAVTGANGIGKTNLLDAIHYLCFTKSYFSGTDNANVQHGLQGFRIEGQMNEGTEETVINIVLRETGKKEISCNAVPYEKFSQHIGKYPCVVIAPDDVELIIGGSEERRLFLDSMLSQLDATYLQQLIIYNKVIQQRNSFLKSCAQSQTRNDALLDVLDEQLLNAGNYIYTKRKDFLPAFNEQVLQFYQTIAGKTEPVKVSYESKLLEQSFESLLQQSREKDYLLQRSTTGIHKDDLLFSLNDEGFKQTASQGQRKSLLFSLKLAEAEVLKEQKGFAPLLLLDDVFEKLDAIRMHNLLDYVCTQFGGQVFLTDPHPDRIIAAFEALGKKVQLIELS